MRELISEHIVTASARRTAPPIVEVAENSVPAAQPRARRCSTEFAARRLRRARRSAGSIASQRLADSSHRPLCARIPLATAAIPAATERNDELKPIPVKTVKVKASTLQTAAIGSIRQSPVNAVVAASHSSSRAVTTASMSGAGCHQPVAATAIAPPLPVRSPSTSKRQRRRAPRQSSAPIEPVSPIVAERRTERQPMEAQCRSRR